ncbi:hypothetical protein HPB49_003167 [Dermacentor silvarum]|uniref:Uncharacterized protein n=1 Tax=Dermacentor silvarum TaxID=543639 RepID=A0ACB8DTD4_DERSI|nr:hypothetical protein HPB49_003167 [Dermacentor silvarum]
MSIPVLQLPPPFLPSPGHPAVPWDQWKQAFQTYMVASGASELPAERRKAILHTCLGMEGQRIFSTLKPADLQSGSALATSPSTGDTGSTNDAYDSAIALLSDHFKRSVNVIVARHWFNRRAQHAASKVADRGQVARLTQPNRAKPTGQSPKGCRRLPQDQDREKGPQQSKKSKMSLLLTQSQGFALATKVPHTGRTPCQVEESAAQAGRGRAAPWFSQQHSRSTGLEQPGTREA